MEKENLVKSVGRALDIIELISTKRKGLGVTEISKQVDINKSSVYRILTTLAQYGYIDQDKETSSYKIGYKFLEISSKLLDSIDLRSEAQPYLKELENETNEVIHLVVYDQGEVVYIEKLEGTETLRMHSEVGKRAPMHCTSVGKAILAYVPVNTVIDILTSKGMPRHTETTITDKDEFIRELIRVKQKGVAFDLEENEYGITCLAVPLFNHLGDVVAAISISGPTIRMSNERLEELQQKLLTVGKSISKRLGFMEK